VKLLLDTHAFLWWCADSPKLPLRARRAVADQSNQVLISAVSGWEVAIKSRLGRLELPERPTEFMVRMLERHGFGVLPVAMAHALGEHELPEIHHDPFDRLLVSQSQSENAVLVTNDEMIMRYPVETLW
jgi:PIN domain nuclease of toxin-antitoxin system